MKRRTFLAGTSTAMVAAHLHAAPSQRRRAAVIGHTGRGNYGHGLDEVWKKIPRAEIVGVADADDRGLEKAIGRLGLNADRGFKDYRTMLRECRPEFVSVGPRHADQHLEMALAAIDSGARGLYVEKPFCRSPAEADQLIAAADKTGAKIAVAHRNRYHPVLPIIDKLVAAGEIGRLLEVRGHGGGDRRGGAEDLWVLGSHILNLFHYFGGKPTACSGILLQDGNLATKEDVVDGAEGLGPLAGNQIHARWLLSKGITGAYTTFTNDDSRKRGYAAQLVGTDGMISLHIDRDPVAWLCVGNPFDPASRDNPRVAITTAGLGKKETRPEVVAGVHDHSIAINDLIDAVDDDRPPLCDARQGLVTIEMICGVFESHRRGGALVDYPLAERENPLAKL